MIRYFLEVKPAVEAIKLEDTEECFRAIEDFIGYSFPVLRNDYGHRVIVLLADNLILVEGSYIAKVNGKLTIFGKDCLENDKYFVEVDKE